MLDSSNPPLDPLLLDLSTNIGSLLVAGMPVEPLLEFGNFVFLTNTSSVVTMSSHISAYVECH